VDLLARAGRLNEADRAERLVKCLQIQDMRADDNGSDILASNVFMHRRGSGITGQK